MIKGSVGKGGLNKKHDVEFVQACLNNYIGSQHVIYFDKLKVGGRNGSKTISAIKVFQSHVVGLAHPDSRIDVSGNTIGYLQKFNTKSQSSLASIGENIFTTFVFSDKNPATSKSTIKIKPTKSSSANKKTDPRKLKTREAVGLVYGVITKDKTWADKNKYLKAFIVPKSISSHKDYKWINTYDPKKRNVSKIWRNIAMHDFLRKALSNLESNNLISELKEFGGCHNIRATRGTVKWSAHSWALAIDLNMSENGLGKAPKLSKEFVKCFTDAGFGWGGNYSRKDGMHFTLAGYDMPKT